MYLKLSKILFFILLLGSSSGFSQNQEDLLSDAIKQKNDSLLTLFFNRWYDESIPGAGSSKVIEREATLLFQLIYDPLHMNKLCGLNNWDTLYTKSLYVAVQNELKIHVLLTDSLKRQKVFTDSIINSLEIVDFKPKIDIKGIKVLYLTPLYKEQIGYLFNRSAASKNQSEIEKATNESLKNFKRLRKFLTVVQGDENQWFVETQPYISLINFNKNLNMARIDFRISNKAGTSYFVKDNGNWRMVWSGLQQN